MKGSVMPMMVNTPWLAQANTQPPKLTPEEEQSRREMLESVRAFERSNMKRCETDDKSGAIVSGKRIWTLLVQAYLGYILQYTQAPVLLAQLTKRT
jgi:hypothetical protein